MRDYARLSPTFWTGTTGKALRRKGPEAVIVALYLVSAPASNMLGLYYQPLLYMAHETGLGIEGASKGLLGCIECGFCSYDDDTEMVWVHEMAAWQIAESLVSTDKRCKGIRRHYQALPDCPFLGAFFDRYQAAFHLTARRGNDGPKPVDNQAPSKPLRSQEQEQEQEHRDRAVGDIAPPPAPTREAGPEPEPPEAQGHAPTPAGAACRLVRIAGIRDVNPSHPDLLRLLAAGVTGQQLADTAVVLVGRGKASFAYLLRTVEGQRHDAAARAAVPLVSPAGPTVPSADFERSQAWLAQQAEAKAAMAPPPAALLARRRLAQEQVA